MGLLRLLTFTLSGLLSVNALFFISGIILFIEPGSEVPRGTDVTLRCRSIIVSTEEEVLIREYTIFRNERVVYTKTTETSCVDEALLYRLYDTRVSNIGEYRCKIKIEGEQKTSGAKKLTVTGLSKPVLHLNTGVVAEGEEVTAKCTAPGETGPMSFNFYEESREISDEVEVNSNEAEAKISLNSTGNHKIHCTYTVLVTPDSFKSEESNNVTLSVKELYSVPTLTMSPAEVFQRDPMTLTCKSESSASERLGKEELTYTLDPPESQLIPRGTGVFSGRVPQDDFSYTCVAQAKGIKKHSETLTVRPKVPVSTPKISVVGWAVLGQPFKILCLSDVGSLPINYTLLRGYDQLSTITVKLPHQQALFTVAVNNSEDISKYMCEAKNSQREGPLSKRLNATVIVPLTQPTLTVIPDLPDISEGDHLYLICGVKGTPPVTFKWYRAGSGEPLYIITTTGNSSNYQIPRLSKEHSGTYYCEAVNHANNVVRSDQVTIEVRLALWKKVVIWVFCLLAMSVVTVVCVLCFRPKRGKREEDVEMSVRRTAE